jgi:hypothetical protein
MVALSTLPGARQRPSGASLPILAVGVAAASGLPHGRAALRANHEAIAARLFAALVGISASWPHAVHSIFTKSAGPA